MTTALSDTTDPAISSLQAYVDTVQLDVSRLKGWRATVEADDSFGRIMAGPQWISGLSMKDGTISGDKFSANVVISSLFTTVDKSVTPTADRWELDTTSFRAYGTVSGVSNTKTLEIKSTGDFTFGTGSGQISYVAATGTMSIPVAVITSLTIDKIGSGTVGAVFTLGAGGKIVDADGSLWDQNGIVLASTGSLGDTLQWKRTSFTPISSIQASIGTGAASLWLKADPSGGGAGAGEGIISIDSSSSTGALIGLTATNAGGTGNAQLLVSGAAPSISGSLPSGITATLIDVNGDMRAYRHLAPGNQSGRWFGDDGTHLTIGGGLLDVTGAIYSTVTGVVPSALPSPSKYITWTGFGPTTYYIPLFSSPNPWAA